MQQSLKTQQKPIDEKRGYQCWSVNSNVEGEPADDSGTNGNTITISISKGKNKIFQSSHPLNFNGDTSKSFSDLNPNGPSSQPKQLSITSSGSPNSPHHSKQNHNPCSSPTFQPDCCSSSPSFFFAEPHLTPRLLPHQEPFPSPPCATFGPAAHLEPLGGVEDSFNSLPLVVDLPPISNPLPLSIHSQKEMLSSHVNENNSKSNENDENSENQSSDLQIENLNSLWVNKKLSKAEKIWRFVKEIGVSGSELEEVYIQKIQELEARDKEVKGKKATINLSVS